MSSTQRTDATTEANGVWASVVALSQSKIMPVLFLIFLVVLWELIVIITKTPSYLLPAPSNIMASVTEHSELLFSHLAVTLHETIMGFLLAVVGGILSALLITRWAFLSDIMMPLLLVAQIVPKSAVAPLILLWFGYGLASKIIIAFLVAFFPILINTAVGLVRCEQDMISLVRCLGATRWQEFVKIRFPHAVPHIFSGMRIAITLAVIGAIIGEFVGGSEGLGYLIIMANSELNTTLAFAALGVLTAGGLALYAAVVGLERLVAPWGDGQQEGEAPGL